jgi:hypothetical protein
MLAFARLTHASNRESERGKAGLSTAFKIKVLPDEGKQDPKRTIMG